MTEDLQRWIVVAHLLRPQGRKGELLAELLTDFPESFRQRQQVLLAMPGSTDPSIGAIPTQVRSFWLPHGRNQGRIVLHLEAASTIEEAERLAGNDVLIAREQRYPLGEDETYISDLIGCTVYDRGQAVGAIRDVHFPTSADGRVRLSDPVPLLVVAVGDEEVLVPFAKQHLHGIDLEERSVQMSLPEGLLELNRPAR